MKIGACVACALVVGAMLVAPALAQSGVSRPKPTWRAVGSGGIAKSKVNASNTRLNGNFEGTMSHTKVRVPLVKSKIAPGAKRAGATRYGTPTVQGFSRSLNGIRSASQSRPIKFQKTFKYRPQSVSGSSR